MTGGFGEPTPLDELCDAAHEKEALVAMLAECRSALLVTDVPPHKDQCYVVIDSPDACLRCVLAECRSALLVTDVPPHKDQCYVVIDSPDACLRCVLAGRVRRLLERVQSSGNPIVLAGSGTGQVSFVCVCAHRLYDHRLNGEVVSCLGRYADEKPCDCAAFRYPQIGDVGRYNIAQHPYPKGDDR